MNLLQLIVVAVAIAAFGVGCTRVNVRTEPEMPVLDPPPPPPRVVETYDEEPIPTVDPSPVEAAAAETPTKPAARPPTTRPETVKPEPARTEPERPAPPAPGLTLKPAPGAETTVASIRSLLSRASNDLNNVNYAALDADGRVQFDTARRFMQQAEEALKGGNLVYAGKLADKAANMASVLVR